VFYIILLIEEEENDLTYACAEIKAYI